MLLYLSEVCRKGEKTWGLNKIEQRTRRQFSGMINSHGTSIQIKGA